jgi:hypothetical protein
MHRSLDITSEPTGATVYLNDVEVGRTPLEVGFTYYGEYDVLLMKDGFEPLRTRKDAVAPIYEHPPLDLAAEAMPWGGETRVPWHFVMTPLPAPRRKRRRRRRRRCWIGRVRRVSSWRSRVTRGGATHGGRFLKRDAEDFL